jgi:hypothetical protein
MNTTTKEKACDPANWRWKRFDVRSDGRIFWQYEKKCQNGERWITWESALKYRQIANLSQKEYKIKNPEKVKLTDLKHRQTNKRNTKKHKHNKSYDQLYKKAYQKTQKHKNYQNNYRKSRLLSDPMFAMKCRLRCRISKAISDKGYSKTCKTSEIIGCSWDFLKAHLESKFISGMSWGNRNLWHIDHIIPIASAKSEEELVKLNHYTNLQPLWAEDNMKKGDKLLSYA